MTSLSTNDGIVAVKTARCVITQEVTKERTAYMMHFPYTEKCGVFVTINKFPSLNLRGCIGFIEPLYELPYALEHAARSACHDPRFQSLKKSELDNVVVEVTILTRPERIIVKEKKELLNEIIIGKHGLLLEYKDRRSVFLPQVPEEWNWNVTEYLENLCMKAGISKDKWKDDECEISSFEGRIFKETTPSGDIIEVKE
ncbi:MAG: TIGR00296 family protein [Methanomassiliicoccaceae archaeon]|nr:TIGR00296 family protein [Methanomassiliicoccaceae archaeon]